VVSSSDWSSLPKKPAIARLLIFPVGLWVPEGRFWRAKKENLRATAKLFPNFGDDQRSEGLSVDCVEGSQCGPAVTQLSFSARRWSSQPSGRVFCNSVSVSDFE
jgi:hypothetical protein